MPTWRSGRTGIASPCRAAPAIAVVAALMTTAAAAPAAAAVRHAVPSGGAASGECTLPVPGCTLKAALAAAQAGDEVRVASGEHTVTEQLFASAEGLTVSGSPGGPRPEIRRVGGTPLVVMAASTLRDLTIVAHDAPGGYALNLQPAGVVGERLTLLATGSTPAALLIRGGSRLHDSVVQTLGTGTVAARTGSTGARFTNTTIRAVAAGATALVADGNYSAAGVEQHVALVNTIVRAPTAGVRVLGRTENVTRVSLRHTNHGVLDASGADDGIDLLEGNQTAPPLLNSGAQQLAGSPTIDAGTRDTEIGVEDAEGRPRCIGSAPDIGAHEHQAGAPCPAVEPPTDPPTGPPADPPAPPRDPGAGPPPAPPSGPVAGVPPVMPPATDASPPALSRASMTARRFALARPRGRKTERRPVGTAFRWTLSEAATVRVVISRRVRSSRRTADCRRRCTVARTVATLTTSAPAGRTTLRFTGRVGGKRLALGRYTAMLQATDRAGNRSRPVRLTFTVVRARR